MVDFCFGIAIGVWVSVLLYFILGQDLAAWGLSIASLLASIVSLGAVKAEHDRRNKRDH